MPLRRSRTPFALLALLGAVACSDQPMIEESPDLATPIAMPRVASGPDQVMPGEVMVKLRPGALPEGVAGLGGVQLIDRPAGGRFAVYLTKVGGERALAARLRQDPGVEWAEPNYLRQPHAIDPRLWAFRNPGGLNMFYSKGKTAGQPIGAAYASIADADEDNVEGYAAGGSAVVVGSIDTGADMDHPEYVGRTIAGKDWYNNDNNPEDDDGHGSHTTGTMAGTNVGVAGVAGAAANVQIYVQKVCGRRGCPTSAIVSAIYAAADYPGMVAMNLSLGGGTLSSAEQAAIAYATGKDVLVIASSGNSGAGSVACPACDPNAISVGSTTWRDAKASYSQYGPGLDITAPGGECYSNTTPEGCIYSANKSGGYTWMQGTSMAAPQVTGAAGVVASVTGLRGAALRSRLLGTTDDLGSAGADNTFGAGRLNVYRAVTNSSLPAGQ
jgi:subtilisin family serine protease